MRKAPRDSVTVITLRREADRQRKREQEQEQFEERTVSDITIVCRNQARATKNWG